MRHGICCMILALSLTPALTGLALCGMSSDSYNITTSVISGGGSHAGSASFTMGTTLGQPSPLMDPTDPPQSSSYDLYPGFWYTQASVPQNDCPGDFDSDGDVDGSDLAVFAADFGRTDCGVPTTCPGDFDNDGDVDGSDLAVFAADFGRTDCPQ